MKKSNTDKSSLVLTPIDEIGACRTGTVAASYKDLIDTIGFEENVEDDPDKVEASWGFQDQHGRKAFLWCYKQGKNFCTSWSSYGDDKLLKELFGKRFIPM